MGGDRSSEDGVLTPESKSLVDHVEFTSAISNREQLTKSGTNIDVIEEIVATSCSTVA